jgi:hypothetical protein
MNRALVILVLALASCGGRPLEPGRRGCEGLQGNYLAHAEQMSGTCGNVGDGVGPLTSFADACTGQIVGPSTTGTVTWTTEASYDADGETGEAVATLVRTGLNPCASEYQVTLTRQP